jgi:hypothetical protein
MLSLRMTIPISSVLSIDGQITKVKMLGAIALHNSYVYGNQHPSSQTQLEELIHIHDGCVHSQIRHPALGS